MERPAMVKAFFEEVIREARADQADFYRDADSLISWLNESAEMGRYLAETTRALKVAGKGKLNQGLLVAMVKLQLASFVLGFRAGLLHRGL